MTERTCSEPGCGRKYRARGLCSTHYNAKYLPDRHRRTAVCAECGDSYTTTRWNGRYCSLWCRDAESRRRKALVGPLPWTDPTRTATPAPEPTPPTRVREWVQGPCAWCGTPFTAEVFGDASRYCSRYCSRKVMRVRRRASEVGASGTYTWGEVMRVYVRIGGCAYCWLPTDDLEPDHVVPLSRGGSNSITNVVPACGDCNRDKRALLLDEWIVDRETRGLAPRRLHPDITHLAVLTAA